MSVSNATVFHLALGDHVHEFDAAQQNGREIDGTVEVKYATGILCNISRGLDGHIYYDFADDPFRNEGDYDTEHDADGHAKFFGEKGEWILLESRVCILW